MGYVVTGLRFHSLIDNKNYPIPLPSDREKKIFKKYIENFRSYQLSENFSPNPAKCARCIYANLCDVSQCFLCFLNLISSKNPSWLFIRMM